MLLSQDSSEAIEHRLALDQRRPRPPPTGAGLGAEPDPILPPEPEEDEPDLLPAAPPEPVPPYCPDAPLGAALFTPPSLFEAAFPPPVPEFWPATEPGSRMDRVGRRFNRGVIGRLRRGRRDAAIELIATAVDVGGRVVVGGAARSAESVANGGAGKKREPGIAEATALVPPENINWFGGVLQVQYALVFLHLQEILESVNQLYILAVRLMERTRMIGPVELVLISVPGNGSRLNR